VLDECSLIYPSFYLEAPPDDGKYFKEKLPIVQQENVWYNVYQDLFVWPASISQIEFGIFENSFLWQASLGTALLTYSSLESGGPVAVNTSAGNFHCNYQHGVLIFSSRKA